jgi:DNA-binding transcriptional LysR family regulator
MNIHHLELFYYVARHGGIKEASRNIPYGVQQPAISAQMSQLEDTLGVTLFNRRPFALTAPGQKLYDFIEPFFSNLNSVEEDIRGGAAHQIRIGSSEIVLRDHLPMVVQSVRKKFPNLKLTLREGYQPHLEKMLAAREIDLAVTLLESNPAPGICSLSLMNLPLVLLVQKKSELTSVEQLWKRDKIEETLLCLPATEIICKNFQQGLARLGIDWFPGIELSSLQLIQTYVENGYGIGLSVAVPKGKISSELRVLPLDGFAPVDFGVLWLGKPNPLMAAFVEAVKQRAASVTGK